jgi:NADH:ubiquinone oxidoreductase subunit 5 (subunit L)/multisubunit Na+/H+ antiporter MnhA subunit
VFLALEVLSLAVYVLTGIRRESAAATEAAFKYFLLGSFSSAFFLYGIAFTYGLAGSTQRDKQRQEVLVGWVVLLRERRAVAVIEQFARIARGHGGAQPGGERRDPGRRL